MNSLTFLLKPTFLVCCVFILISGVIKTESVDYSNSETDLDISTPNVAAESAKDILEFTKRKKDLRNAVKIYFENAIEKGLIVGAGVSVIKGDSVLLSTGYGKRKSNESTQIDRETVFRLGSISKGFAGVLVGKLKTEGLLDWNDKLTDYLPEFHFKDYDYTSKLKLSHILSHTSGAPYHSYTDLIEGGVDLKTIASKFKTVKPISEPGSLYSYQNALFALSGEVTQCVTGNSITTDLNNYFFKPLNMHSTSTDFKTLLASDNKAYPHRKYRKRWKAIKLTDKYYNAVSAGGINASADDMAKWMKFLLGNNEDIMTSQDLSEVFKPIIKIGGHRKYYQRWDGHIASYYGYGWRIHNFIDESTGQENRMIHHGGSVNDFRNEIALFPEDDLGICVLMNSMTTLSKQVIPDLRKIISEIYSDPLAEGIVAMN